MRLLTNEQMKAADAYTIGSKNIPAAVLMERAGTALFLETEKHIGAGQVLVVCGVGNNGGDGLVCARKLQENNHFVKVLLTGACKTKESAENYDKYVALGGKVVSQFPKGKFSVVIDCLFGTGFAPRGKEDALFEQINAYKKNGAYVVSADLPSGLSDDGTMPSGVCVEADKTVCFGFQKTATVLGDGLDVCGEIVVADIGIVLPEEKASDVFLIERERVRKSLPARKRNTHKGTYGRAAIIGGSSAYTGAAYLAISACVHGGAGYSTLYTDKDILPAYYLNPPEALLVGCEKEFCKEDYVAALENAAIGFGVGATNGVKTEKVLRHLLRKYTGKLVIDADGLNALASISDRDKQGLLGDKQCSVVLTPHIGEFKRLIGKNPKDKIENIIQTAKDFAKQYGVVLVLKSASTIITDGEAVYISTAGNAGQAKGGSGDVLTGLMTSLLATGLQPLEGAIAAVYLGGTAAEIAAQDVGESSLTASTVIAYLGKAFLAVQR